MVTGADRNYGSRRVDAWLLVVAFVAPIIVYWSAMRSGYVSDDYLWHQFFNISFSDLIELLNRQRSGEIDLIYFRPAVVASYQIDYRLFGDNPFSLHLVNLIFHAVNGCLLFWLARIIGLDRIVSFIAAMTFAINPVNSETVIWISSRGDILALTFLFLALIFGIKWRRTGESHLFILSFVAFFISINAKESAAAGILLIPLLDRTLKANEIFVRVDDERATRIRSLLIAFAVVIIYAVGFRFWLFGDIGGHRFADGDPSYTDITRLPEWMANLKSDLMVLFTPVNRELFAEWPNGWRIAIGISGIGLALTLLYGLVTAMNNRTRDRFAFIAMISAILWIIVMLLPILPIMPVDENLRRARYLYASSAGLSILMGISTMILLARGGLMKSLLFLLMILIFASSGYSIFRYNSLWLECGKIAAEIQDVMDSNIEHLTDNSEIYAVNFPWRIKGAACAPFKYGNYLDFSRGLKDVNTIEVSKSGDEVIRWWASVRDEADAPIAGFFWEWTKREVLILPPLETVTPRVELDRIE